MRTNSSVRGSTAQRWDAVVVGAGTAGSVVARRLSDDPARQVLLIEAGPSYAGADLPTELGDAWAAPMSHDWGYTGTSHGRTIPLPRGRVVGGSSAVNYCVALRSRPSDHREWANLAGDAWAWREAVRIYQNMENGFPQIPLERAELSAYGRRIRDAGAALGYAWLPDINAASGQGVGVVPLTATGRHRASIAEVYLADRPNLTVMSGSQVDRVIVRDGMATGVALVGGVVVEAGETVLCAGSYATPAILLRSGIGPAADLARLGIPSTVIRDGVGRGLIEHSAIRLSFHAPGPAESDGPRIAATLLANSGIGDDDIDLHIHAFHPVPTDRYSFTVGLLTPRSRGTVLLTSPDPEEPPRVDLNLVHHESDGSALARGVLIARRLAAQAIGDEPLELPPFAGEVALTDTIKAWAGVYFHPMGTCRMGVPSDPHAVVDSQCRVIGTERLSVIDASVIPVPVRATTNLPTVFVAERAMELRTTP